MLPSMYSPMESEVFPPDVCYSGEGSSPPTTMGKVANESQDADNESDVENAEDALLCPSEVISESDVHEDTLEGAVGGILPDLCNTGSRTVSLPDDQIVTNNPSNELNSESLQDEQIPIYVSEYDITADEITSKAVSENSLTMQIVEENSDLSDEKYKPNECADFLLKRIEENYVSHKNINILPCETGDLKNKLHNILETKDNSSSLNFETRISVCDMYGALDKEEREASATTFEKLGLDLVRKNVLHSSHPSYHEWKCSAVIPSYLLSPVSLHSHGTSLGYEAGPSITLGASPGRSSSGDRNCSEDEQIKLAKRFGLIRHLPCGVFDGSTKTRECVICMIDFSVGDRVRYLPCMHTYHTDCIDDWLIRSFTCPSCLEPVDAALLSTYETT